MHTTQLRYYPYLKYFGNKTLALSVKYKKCSIKIAVETVWFGVPLSPASENAFLKYFHNTDVCLCDVHLNK